MMAYKVHCSRRFLALVTRRSLLPPAQMIGRCFDLYHQFCIQHFPKWRGDEDWRTCARAWQSIADAANDSAARRLKKGQACVAFDATSITPPGLAKLLDRAGHPELAERVRAWTPAQALAGYDFACHTLGPGPALREDGRRADLTTEENDFLDQHPKLATAPADRVRHEIRAFASLRSAQSTVAPVHCPTSTTPEPALTPPTAFDPIERAKEKQASRDADAAAIASGEKTVAQVRKDNGAFAFPRDRVKLTHPRREGVSLPSRPPPTLPPPTLPPPTLPPASPITPVLPKSFLDDYDPDAPEPDMSDYDPYEEARRWDEIKRSRPKKTP